MGREHGGKQTSKQESSQRDPPQPFRERIEAQIREQLEAAPERLTVKALRPASKLSPEEAALELWRRNLTFTYTENRKYFARWWRSLLPGHQQWLSAAAESFASYEDWSRAWIRSAHHLISDNASMVEAERIKRKLPREVLGLDALQLKKALHDRRFLVGLRDALDQAAGIIGTEIGIGEGRPIENEARDRRWSQLRFCGKTYKEIASETGQWATVSTVSKAIDAYRKRNEELTWALRISIYITGFPKYATEEKPRTRSTSTRNSSRPSRPNRK